MTLVFAAIAPHGDLVFEDGAAPATRAGMEELGRRFAAAAPDIAIVLTPHSVHVEGHFAVVTAGHVGEAETDRGLAASLVEELRAAGLPAVGVSYGGNDPAEAVMPIDWATEIPLAFMRAPRIVAVAPARDRPLADHVRAGQAVAAAVGEGRTAVVASADHGHAHREDGPYGYDPAAAEYDARIAELVRGDRLAELLDLDPALVERARVDSLWQLLMLHGALGDGWRAELLSYEAPTYFGMLCAAYSRRGSA